MGQFETQIVVDNLQRQLNEVKQKLVGAEKRIEELEKQLKTRDGEVEDMMNAFDPCWPEDANDRQRDMLPEVVNAFDEDED